MEAVSKKEIKDSSRALLADAKKAAELSSREPKPYAIFSNKDTCHLIVGQLAKEILESEDLTRFQQLRAGPDIPVSGEVYVLPWKGDTTTDKFQWKDGSWKAPNTSPLATAYFSCSTFKSFKKTMRKLNVENPKYLLVAYHGDDSGAVRKPHGNTKKGNLHVPTSKSTRSEMQEAINSGKSPAEAHTSLRAVHKTDAFVNQPKSAKQFYYLKSKEKEVMEMNGGALAALIELAGTWQSQGIWRIKHITLFPDLIVIYIHERLLSVFIDCVTGTFAPSDMKFMKHYTPATFDETFNCTYSYVTEVVTTVPFLEQTPVIAPIVILHTKKDQDTFEFIGEQLRRLVPQLTGMKVGVTDLEKSIHNGLKYAFPDTVWTFCRNHLYKAVLKKCNQLKINEDYARHICGIKDMEGLIDKPLKNTKKESKNFLAL